MKPQKSLKWEKIFYLSINWILNIYRYFDAQRNENDVKNTGASAKYKIKSNETEEIALVCN